MQSTVLYVNDAYAVVLQSPNNVDSELSASAVPNNNGNEYEWIFHRVLPRSGSEIPHNLTYQAQGGTVKNCYAYAFNAPMGGTNYMEHLGGSILNLILMYGYTLSDKHNYGTLPYAISRDAEDFSLIITPIVQYGICNNNRYKTALVVEAYNDSSKIAFHWYRQGPNGLWSSKLGQSGSVTMYDGGGQIIFDPQYSNRDFSSYGLADYVEFYSYFAVAPMPQ